MPHFTRSAASLAGIALGWVLALSPLAISAHHSSDERGSFRTYMPLLSSNETFGNLPALWSHTDEPAPHEVLLLRCSFTLSEPLEAAELQIFADTRYAVWLNGTFLGRGPARFSRVRREYDPIPLGTVQRGAQALSVLVQWAPNMRRSESLSPQVQARLTGRSAGLRRSFEMSPSVCRALPAAAWNTRSASVHAWDLIGPTELLDLRDLPAGWSLPGFDDSGWPQAAVRPPQAAVTYERRSIQPLVEVPMALRVQGVGYLAPGFWVGELAASAEAPASYQFTLAAPTSITLQALEAPGGPPLPQAVTLDGEPLLWAPVSGAPPDVRVATAQLSAGQHRLRVDGLSPGGRPWAFAISRAGISSAPPPLGVGGYAGPRLLLADLAPAPEAVTVARGSGLDLTVNDGPAYVVLDLGRTVHGRLSAEVAGPAGTIVDVGWDERLWQSLRPLPHPGSLHPEWSQADSWALAREPREITTLDARAGRYVLIAVWGEGPVTLRNLRVLEERYPLSLRGSFVSASSRLNQIWMIGVQTLYPSMTDAYADPWRERGQWWGDAAIADRANQVSFGETGLLRRGLQQMADSVRAGQPGAFAPSGGDEHLLDYSMLWLRSVYDYGTLTGDWAFVARLYPQIRAVMATLSSLEHPETGLLDLSRVDRPGRAIYIDANSYWDRLGQSTAANAYYYQALRDAAAIGSRIGKPSHASDWQARADQLRQRANQLLYRQAESRYIGGLVQGQAVEATPQAQAAALAFGLVPAGQEQRLADTLLSMLGTPERPNVQMFGIATVLEALGRVGRIDDGLMVIDRFFGSMLDRGATTWWEHFGADQSYSASLSHAWGSSPTWFLSTYALGARRTGPTSWQVLLAPSSLRAVAGRPPPPRGELAVRWSAERCDSLLLSIEAPAGSSGTAIVPGASTARELWVDGARVWADGLGLGPAELVIDDHTFQLPLGPGTHQIELRGPAGAACTASS